MVKNAECSDLIKAAQKFVDVHHDKKKKISKEEEKISEKNLEKRLEAFKGELKEHIEVSKMSDQEVYSLARKLVINNAKKEL